MSFGITLVAGLDLELYKEAKFNKLVVLLDQRKDIKLYRFLGPLSIDLVHNVVIRKRFQTILSIPLNLALPFQFLRSMPIGLFDFDFCFHSFDVIDRAVLKQNVTQNEDHSKFSVFHRYFNNFRRLH